MMAVISGLRGGMSVGRLDPNWLVDNETKLPVSMPISSKPFPENFITEIHPGILADWSTVKVEVF